MWCFRGKTHVPEQFQQDPRMPGVQLENTQGQLLNQPLEVRPSGKGCQAQLTSCKDSSDDISLTVASRVRIGPMRACHVQQSSKL